MIGLSYEVWVLVATAFAFIVPFAFKNHPLGFCAGCLVAIVTTALAFVSSGQTLDEIQQGNFPGMIGYLSGAAIELIVAAGAATGAAILARSFFAGRQNSQSKWQSTDWQTGSPDRR